MKPKHPELTFALYMSVRYATPLLGVHVRGNGRDLSTLCGMSFDDDGNYLSEGGRDLGEVITPADEEIVTCPYCIRIIDDLQRESVDRDRAEVNYQNYASVSSASAGNHDPSPGTVATRPERQTCRSRGKKQDA